MIASYNGIGGLMKGSLSGFGNKELKKENDIKKTNISQEDVYNEYDKIKNMSQAEAQSQLFSEVLRQKQNGTFNFEALSNQVESLRGYLPEKDFQNLQRMLENLR